MFEELRSALASVDSVVSSLDIATLDGRQAVTLVDLFARLERVAAAGKTVAARRVEETRAWYGQGFQTMGKWMAHRASTTLGAAVATLETGRRLDGLPATKKAFLSGELSAHQAQEIAAAAAAEPAAEGELLAEAERSSVNGLRERCRQVIAAASHDLDLDERIHRSRYYRSWSEADGAVRVDMRLDPDSGAKLNAAVGSLSMDLLEQARRAGAPEKRECYAADALIALVCGQAAGPSSVVNVLVDYEAIERGHLEKGERCQIPGQGPIPVAAARRLAGSGFVRAVLRKDADVRAVVSYNRHVPAGVRAALFARDPSCVVPHCDETKNLEIHHLRPYSETKVTKLEDLALLCHWHHLQVTHRGWLLIGRPGQWQYLPAGARAGPPDS